LRTPPTAEKQSRLAATRGLLVAALSLGLWSAPAEAYVGPGAGFALVSSFLVVFTTMILVVVTILIWPFRTLWRVVRRRRPPKPWVKRLIVMGFDGQDARLTESFLAEGKLPNFQKLKEMGCYHRLPTTFPSVTPVAWSTFSTGTSPAKHGIFDFLDRDPRSYLPMLSSVRIGSVDRFLKLGKYRIPLAKPELRLLRKSKAFWSILGEQSIWSTILRMPVSFPPERFRGAQLSAMCTPDLLGTQGTFLLYTTRPEKDRFQEGGLRVVLTPNGDRFETRIQGPENAFLEGSPPLEIPLVVELDRQLGKARITAGDSDLELPPQQLSPWTALSFQAAPGIKISGLCRMMVTEMDEHFSLYISPICLDPEKPAMPVSHPSYYATYLAKRIGPYSTLGMAEDTWALNEGVIDDATFLKLNNEIDHEREQMFFGALDRLRSGCLACVFDASDRIGHMFWRFSEEGHPAARAHEDSPHRGAIEEAYVRNDELVGRTLDRLESGDLLMVLSDHGMTSFRRGCNLNHWLLEQGYLALKPGTDGSSEWLRDVDWSRTRAYVVGLTGMFLNIKGREANGTVEPGEEARSLKAELIQRLGGLVDEETGDVAINEVFETASLYDGPYLGRAPDFLVGYNEGYRHSWDCASGVITGPVFKDNDKAWSGDHCVDPRLVPGIFFCSHAIDDDQPTLLDMAPTVLRLFGLEPAPFMEGSPLFHDNPLKAAARAPGAGRG
jgi:predicted AlkP superfamily phosphohydrolase/phosphomutase